MNTIRLMLVDDHEVVRTGLRSFLEAQGGLLVVAEAGSGEEALAKIAGAQPDVVVMDITMPGMDGLEATRQLKMRRPECQILALTVHEDRQYFIEMLAAGATGYLTKIAAAQELVSAIRAVAVGNVYLQPVLARWLLEDYRRMAVQLPASKGDGRLSQPKDLDVLSKREQQVLQLVADGYTNVEVGEKLGISFKTVARHRERIMDKLDVHSSSELVKFAIRTGLIRI
jgi:DNA-binding NarL/FixJ family response regulator